jgi:hypothetical protein
METVNTRTISIIEPVAAAISKTRQILFAPFNLEKWLIIGFCAWLAGFRGLNTSFGNFFPDGCKNPADISQLTHEIRIFITQNLPWLLPVAVGSIALLIILTLLFTWLKSRGQLMFLDAIVRNRPAIAQPWSQYAAQGNSLFGFKLILWLAGSLVMLAAIVPIIFIVVMFAKTDFKTLQPGPIVIASLLMMVVFVIGLALSLINVLTDDFVVPLMYRRRCPITAAWKEFKHLVSARPAAFILYLLFLVVVNIVLALLTMTIGIAACCCFCCVSWMFFIPLIGSYLSTVLFLPLAVWRRSYAVLFLSQFGPAYNVFQPNEPAPTVLQIESPEPDNTPNI